MGILQARWILVCVVTAACVLTLWKLSPSHWTGSSALTRSRRWTYYKDQWWVTQEDNHPSPILTHSWYRYVTILAHSYGRKGCYACSKTPHSSTQQTLYGKPMMLLQASCAASMAGIGRQHENLRINFTHAYDPGVAEGTCNQHFWVDFNITTDTPFRPQRVEMPKGSYDPKVFNFPMCYWQNWEYGTTSLGNTTNCDMLWAHGAGAPVNISGPSNGTYWVQGVWWLCGHWAYPLLPKNWTGTCTPIFVSDHTFLVSRDTIYNNTRRRRESTPEGFKPHDSVWGSDVPRDHKLWSDASKVALALFPWDGVGKVMLRLETTDYRLGCFINATLKVQRLQNEELDAIRTMTLQHHLVLDYLTAAAGGLCVMLNSSCCTHIPDNVHSEDMAGAMDRLKALQQVMEQDHVTADQWDFFSWLTGGPWWHLLLKLLTPLILILILFCIFTSCIMPCIRSMITNTMTRALVQYQLLHDHIDPETKSEDTKL